MSEMEPRAIIEAFSEQVQCPEASAVACRASTPLPETTDNLMGNDGDKPVVEVGSWPRASRISGT